MRTSNNKKVRVVGLLAVVFAVTAFAYMALGGVGKSSGKDMVKKPLPLVTVTYTTTVDLPIEFSAQGHLVALNQVEIRPQINGVIRSVNFKEGDQIKAGQLLFSLDDSDILAQNKKFKAQIEQIRAQLDDANRDYARSTELVKSAFISASVLATSKSKVDGLVAQLKSAQAELESAAVQLGFTRINSPIAGQAGALSIHPGSLAQTSAALPLLTIVQMNPIAVEFSLPEQAMAAILAGRAEKNITVSLKGAHHEKIQGSLSFINNTINTDTATINLKASFDNAKQILWPGQFANLTVYAGVDKGAVVLPPSAILEGPKGRFVYAVDDHDQALSKPVTLLRIQNGVAVIAGLNKGERVVLEGGQNLSNGMQVKISGKVPTLQENLPSGARPA